MKRNKWTVIALLVLLLLATISCGSLNSGPGQTVERFFKALDKGEIDDAMGYLSIDTIQALGYDKWNAALTDVAFSIQESGGIRSVKIADEKIIGDTARVTFELKSGDKETESDSLELIKENDEWKIVLDPWQK